MTRLRRSEQPGGPQARGRAGEDAALDYLVRQGLLLVERNFRCRSGEIDLVMRDGDCVVFVEVRLRSPGAFGDAAASVTAAKRARLASAALTWLQRYRNPPPCRFDVIAINGERLDWLRDAISA